jgi:hypothetical protein
VGTAFYITLFTRNFGLKEKSHILLHQDEFKAELDSSYISLLLEADSFSETFVRMYQST